MDSGEYAPAFCAIKAIRRYDPDYRKKVREAATTIDKEFHAQSRINTEALSEVIGDLQYTVDDCSRFLRLLGKHFFLAPIAAGTNPAVVYRRITEWPPPVSSFGPGSAEVSYFAPK
jgi:hypothetical protein